jgi:hypothetical protein
MTGLELLEKYPLSAKIVKDWFIKSMLESFKDADVPEDFKQFVLEQGIEDDKVGKLIDVNVRILFDVFDENDICINIERSANKIVEWSWEISPGHTENSVCKSRKEAEHASIEKAFEILDSKLTPPTPVEEIEVTGEEIVKE